MRRKFRLVVFTGCLILTTTVLGDKPYNQLEVNTVDLNDYPQKITNYAPDVEVAIGDLHGNALKLLYFLISNGVVSLSKEDYQNFAKIYKKPPDKLSRKDIGLFHAILNSAAINSEHKLIFLGDDLCDRGMNDYYTLNIYKKLDEAHVHFDIVLSNHNNFFLSAYERPEQSFSYNPYGEGRYESIVQSMLNLGKLIDVGLADKQDVVDIVQKYYLKHLILPGMVVNKSKKEITLYTHAPIDITILLQLAKDLHVSCENNDLDQLVGCLTGISQQVQSWIMHNQFSENYNRLNKLHENGNSLSPIKQILWNRDYAILTRDYQLEGKTYGINYVHGHDSQPNVFDLDNQFGKGQHNDKGPYAIFITHH